MNKQIAAMAAALILLSASASFAQMHKPMKRAKGESMMFAKAVYVCKDCHQYFTPAQAQKLGYKDADGGRLVRVSKIPVGYTPGLKIKR